MALGTRLKKIRLVLNLRQKELADALYLKSASISQFESNKNKPSLDTLIKLSNAYNISLQWLLTGEGSMFLEEEDNSNPLREMVSIERGTGISAGYGIEAFEDEPIMLPKALLHGYPAKMFFAMPVIGRSMLPEINPGELALIRKQVLWDNTHNKVCAIRINGEVLLKKVVQLNKNILLQPFNPNFEPIIVNQETMGNIILLGTLYLTIRLWEKDKKQK